MTTSSPSSPLKPEPKSILLIGPAGGAKTTLALQFPDPFVVDCDGKLTGPERFLRTKLPGLTYQFERVYMKEDGSRHLPEDCFDKLDDFLKLLKVKLDSGEVKAQTIILDNLTIINEWIVRKVLKRAGKTTMEIREWGPFATTFIDLLLGRLASLNRTTICICHEEPIYENDSANMGSKMLVGYDSSVQGKVGYSIGSYFSDVWRCESFTKETQTGAIKNNIVSYQITGWATSKVRFLKNSFGFPSTPFVVGKDELAMEKMKEYLKL